MTDTTNDGGSELQSVPVNVYTAEEALVIVAPLPGVMPDDVEVVVDGTEVTIRASQRTPAPKEYIVQEWTYGPYERRLTIPEGYAGESKASFGNGQLAVSLGKGDGAGSQTIRPNANS